LPVLSAYLVATTELVCGILLIVGLLSRLAPIPLIIAMIVAYVTTEQDALGQVFKTLDPVLTAAPFLFLFASLLILIFGPGRYSLDHWIARKKWGTE
jgi:putative oxidoreductase